MRQVVVSDPARSPVWTERSLRRRIEVLQVPIDEAKAAAKELGGSLNDFFVAGAAGGAGAYHRKVGQPVDELRISMPVSTRKDGSAGGNSFTPTRVLVPVGIEDPAERFAAIRERLDTTKREKAMGLVSGVAGVANLLPTSVAVRFARQQVETVDFTTSNVRGAPFPLYIAGARILANYPVGPCAGTAWNLTLMSYDGHLDMGLNCDSGAVEDPGAAARPHRGGVRRAARGRDSRSRLAGRPRSRRRRRPATKTEPASGTRLGADGLDRHARLGGQLGRREEHADVEQQVGDLVGGHELAVHELGEAAVDEAERLVDHGVVPGIAWCG